MTDPADRIRDQGDAVIRASLEVGAWLAQARWSGQYLVDGASSWREWLKQQQLPYPGRATPINARGAAALTAWAVCHSALVAANGDRPDPLPLPGAAAEVDPFRDYLRRVDDWTPEGWPVLPEGDDLIPPYAQEQPDFIRAWEQVWRSLPPERRYDRDGRPAPPPGTISRTWVARERQLRSPDPGPPVVQTLDIHGTPTLPEDMADAAAARPRRSVATPRTPSPEERALYELQDWTRRYRLRLLSLTQEAEALHAFLTSAMVTHGPDYLALARALDLGAYSVDDDIDKLRTVVELLQQSHQIMLGNYQPPEPIQVDP